MNAHATEKPVQAEFRPRPYLGRHVPPSPPARPVAPTIAERIEILIESVSMARRNARNAMRDGDYVRASAAFYRAHDYVEMIRELRAQL